MNNANYLTEGIVHHRSSTRSAPRNAEASEGSGLESETRLRVQQQPRTRVRRKPRRDGGVSSLVALIAWTVILGPLGIGHLRKMMRHKGLQQGDNKFRTTHSQLEHIAGSFGHPLEGSLGQHQQKKNFGIPGVVDTIHLKNSQDGFESRMEELRMIRARQEQTIAVQHYSTMSNTSLLVPYSALSSTIPFVIMAYKRVNYLKQVMDSLRDSDFPRDRIPVIISHDGRVPEMTKFVESIRSEFQIVQLFHPYSCHEHPDSFPGNDPSLNHGFGGDKYGNPRSEWATCCKHHFTWMINAVFGLRELRAFDTFFFLEEDYIVAKTIYSSICTGLNVMAATEDQTTNGYFGLAMNATAAAKSADLLPKSGPFPWTVKTFNTGPMTMNRRSFALLRNHSKEYCNAYDEYNWDWTLYHLMRDQLLPSTTLVPFRIPLVQHIGAFGMHSEHASEMDLVNRHLLGVRDRRNVDFTLFLSSDWVATNKTMGKLKLPPPRFHKESGGWGHPMDRTHCLSLFEESSQI